MSIDNFPVGQEMDVTYPNFKVSLKLISVSKMSFEIKEGPFAHSETVEIEVAPLGNDLFAVSWTEESGAKVTNVQNFDRGQVHSFVSLPDGQFLRMVGPIEVTRPAERLSDDRPQQNKKLVREAMMALFQRRDAAAVDRFYAVDYVQHNPSIPQGRAALHSLVADLSSEVFYEPGLTIAEGNLVAIHGRIRGWAETPQAVVDIFRVENGQLAEHWDVLQNEVPSTAAVGGASMFDPREGEQEI